VPLSLLVTSTASIGDHELRAGLKRVTVSFGLALRAD
jgi:hypothetical protein